MGGSDGGDEAMTAADFDLPAEPGGRLHLAELRGRPVLLVFLRHSR